MLTLPSTVASVNSCATQCTNTVGCKAFGFTTCKTSILIPILTSKPTEIVNSSDQSFTSSNSRRQITKTTQSIIACSVSTCAQLQRSPLRGPRLPRASFRPIHLRRSPLPMLYQLLTTLERQCKTLPQNLRRMSSLALSTRNKTCCTLSRPSSPRLLSVLSPLLLSSATLSAPPLQSRYNLSARKRTMLQPPGRMISSSSLLEHNTVVSDDERNILPGNQSDI